MTAAVPGAGADLAFGYTPAEWRAAGRACRRWLHRARPWAATAAAFAAGAAVGTAAVALMRTLA
ncbi:MAG: hypothetical protein AB7P02_29200 [Alphaproteobacteria bacterium]